MKRSLALALLLTLESGAAHAHFPAKNLRLPAKVELVVTYQPRAFGGQGDTETEHHALPPNPAQPAKPARESKRSASLGVLQVP